MPPREPWTFDDDTRRHACNTRSWAFTQDLVQKRGIVRDRAFFFDVYRIWAFHDWHYPGADRRTWILLSLGRVSTALNITTWGWSINSKGTLKMRLEERTLEAKLWRQKEVEGVCNLQMFQTRTWLTNDNPVYARHDLENFRQLSQDGW